MTLSRDTMLELMAYADGELDESDRSRIEKLIAADADAKRVVASMGVLGKAVQRAYEPPAASMTDGLVDEIMASVEKEGVPRKPSVRPPKVVDLRDLRERRLKVGAAIVAVVALAAGIVLTTHKQNQSPFQAFQTPPPRVTAPTPAPAPAPVPPEQLAAAGVDVEQVDSTRDVEVFYLPSSVRANASSVVVWIDDKGTAP